MIAFTQVGTGTGTGQVLVSKVLVGTITAYTRTGQDQHQCWSGVT